MTETMLAALVKKLRQHRIPPIDGAYLVVLGSWEEIPESLFRARTRAQEAAAAKSERISVGVRAMFVLAEPAEGAAS